MERRKFIKDTCQLCMAASFIAILNKGCIPAEGVFSSTVENNKMMIPLTELSGKNYLLARSKQLAFDIFIHKNKNDNYTAVLMKCSHRDAPVHYTTGGLVCHEHGSRFDFEGAVTKEPAETPLTKFPVTLNTTHLIINLKNG